MGSIEKEQTGLTKDLYWLSQAGILGIGVKPYITETKPW